LHVDHGIILFTYVIIYYYNNIVYLRRSVDAPTRPLFDHHQFLPKPILKIILCSTVCVYKYSAALCTRAGASYSFTYYNMHSYRLFMYFTRMLSSSNHLIVGAVRTVINWSAHSTRHAHPRACTRIIWCVIII